jgi:hypothetical protein
MEEQERLYYLKQHREAWEESERRREFLRACEASLTEQKGELAPDSAEARWLRWAHGYADRIDPLKNGGFDETILHLIRKAESS